MYNEGEPMNRRQLRTCTFEVLFRYNFHNTQEMPEQTAFYLENLDEPLSENEQNEIKERTEKILPLIPDIDAIISSHAVNWTINRMNHVDLTILRLAVFEMRYDEAVPEKVAINEAVELAKQYGGESSSSFINGVLAKIMQS